jgi:hypothetical protein
VASHLAVVVQEQAVLERTVVLQRLARLLVTQAVTGTQAVVVVAVVVQEQLVATLVAQQEAQVGMVLHHHSQVHP